MTARFESPTTGYIFEEIEGDLFSSTDSICHCVSACLHMGKGIAPIFKERFKRVDELKRQNAKPGEMCSLYIPDEDRYIYYLVTKEKYYNKPTYTTLEGSLTEMRDHCFENGIRRLSMPLLGCGLDRLEWDQVKKIIHRLFEPIGMHITVYKLPEKKGKR
jgi:O-acetyl-ADP-ribose deacetylase (regulator of RNase III)